MKIEIRRPAQMKAKEIDDVCELVRSGGEVAHEGLPKRLMQSHLIATLKVDSGLASVGAIKSPTTSYLKNTIANSRFEIGNFPEFGYVVTAQNHRGKGFARKLSEQLLIEYNGKLFATARTDNDPMNAILRDEGFTTVGESWKSIRHSGAMVMLWIRERGRFVMTPDIGRD